VVVELLALGQFSGSPHFELPNIPGAILMQVSERPLLMTREVDGETYTVQQYDFALFVQRGGPCVVPPMPVRVGTKERFDTPMVEHRLHTKEVTLEATVPPGAPPDGAVVSTPALTVTESWSPLPGSARVGDAFTRNITLRADQVPGMLLPVLAHERVEGLAVYPKPPLIQDHTERGEFAGERLESVTYVCEQTGAFDIPEVVIRWWDPNAKTWHEKRLPAVKLEVAALAEDIAQTQTGQPAGATSRPVNWVWWSAVAAMVVLLALASPWLRRAWQRWQQVRLASEPGHFARLMRACRAGNAPGADRTLTLWLDCLALPRTALAAETTTDAALAKELYNLQETLIGRRPSWSGPALAIQLRAWRRHVSRQGRRHLTVARLPELNPLGEPARWNRQAL
jgi:hypothetical protein